MALHKLELKNDGVPVNLRTDAVPPIDLDASIYIQNISNGDVNVGESEAMPAHFVCTSIGTNNSQMNMSANQPVWVNTDNRRAILTIESS